MVNKVLLVGRLCTDPELKYTPSGVAVNHFRVAVDRQHANAAGERETDFIDVVAWRQQAEFMNTYLTKGRLVMVDGRLQVRQWQTPDGQRRRSMEVVADQVKALDRPREPREGDSPAPARTPATRADEHAPREDTDYEAPEIIDPFADQ